MNKVFRVGAFWKTRRGEKVEIVKLNVPGLYPILALGSVDYGNGDYSCDCYRVNVHGQYMKQGDHSKDLVEPWQDPPSRRLAYYCDIVGSDAGRSNIFIVEEDALQPAKDVGWKRAPWLDEPTKEITFRREVNNVTMTEKGELGICRFTLCSMSEPFVIKTLKRFETKNVKITIEDVGE